MGLLSLATPGRDSPHRGHWLRSAFLALLVTPLISLTMAAPATSSRETRSQPARFSDLAELTPANVRGLLPLVSRAGVAQFDDQAPLLRQRSTAHGLQVDSLASADERLQRFLEERVHLQLAIEEPARLAPPAGAAGCEISYVIGMTAAAAPAATGVPEERELRAWDPIERRVLWSVTEALPISAGTLVTAGGLVFYVTSDGWLKALDARSGRTLWRYKAQGRELDAPFSYRGSDGHQYIAVHSLPRASADGPQTLLVFALAH